MKKSDIRELPEYYDYYILLNDDIELNDAFERSIKEINTLDVDRLKRIGLRTYAEGKWSTHTIIQHLTDWERIWCYRLLLSVRNEGTIPPGLDHNLMADHANADDLSIDQLLDELRAVRMATKGMFNNFDERILRSDCKFNKTQMSVLAMGFNILGHQIHHFNIIRERYLPLAD
ncbi:MAG: DinB family protein [Saprospiraceae bacterium]|nr:MAG: DinB family protein [Saprospiraceae bacterium]